MSGRVQALLLGDVEHPLAALVRDAFGRVDEVLHARRERRRRARVRGSMMPMPHHLLHDLGMVEADARRLGWLG